MHENTLNAKYFSQICIPEQSQLYLQLDEQLNELLEQDSKQIPATKDDLQRLHISLECIPKNVKNTKTIIVRHALAWHNYFKRATGFRDRNIFNYKLLDPPLHYLGVKQCEFMSSIIHQEQFEIVYVSPLQRAIQTAQLLFKDHPQKDKIVFKLSPICTEKVSSQYSVYKWGNLTKLKQNNGNPINFDFSDFSDLEDFEFWQFKLLNQMDQVKGMKSDRFNQEKFICENYIKKNEAISMENSVQTHKRTQEFRKELDITKRICVVSHSQFLKTLITDSPKVNGLHQEIELKNGSIVGIELK